MTAAAAIRARLRALLLAGADALVDAARAVGGGAPAARPIAGPNRGPLDRSRDAVRGTLARHAAAMRALVTAVRGRELGPEDSLVAEAEGLAAELRARRLVVLRCGSSRAELVAREDAARRQ